MGDKKAEIKTGDGLLLGLLLLQKGKLRNAVFKVEYINRL